MLTHFKRRSAPAQGNHCNGHCATAAICGAAGGANTPFDETSQARFRLALAGNPNVGKTTLFNALTGERQHVSNWTGTTVAHREGLLQLDDQAWRLVDLPGVYSLSPYSPEERIARDFLLQERPDLIINVVDAANLERNLYLTVQLLETNIPLVVVLNKIDVARRRHITIDRERLSTMLGGVPTFAVSAARGKDIVDLRHWLKTVAGAVQLPAPLAVNALTLAEVAV